MPHVIRKTPLPVDTSIPEAIVEPHETTRVDVRELQSLIDTSETKSQHHDLDAEIEVCSDDASTMKSGRGRLAHTVRRGGEIALGSSPALAQVAAEAVAEAVVETVPETVKPEPPILVEEVSLAPRRNWLLIAIPAVCVIGALLLALV